MARACTLKYRHGGEEKRLPLGVYLAVSLAQAREAREAARKVLASGADPAQLKQDVKLIRTMSDANTFESVARQWWAHWNGPKSPRHADYVMRRLEADVFPALEARPVDTITAPNCWRWRRRSRPAAPLTLRSGPFKPAGKSCGMRWRMV